MREIVFIDLPGSQAENHRSRRSGRGRKFNPVETEKHDDGGECRSLVAVDKGMVSGNTEGVGGGKHREIGFSIREFVERPSQSRVEEPKVTHSIGTAKQRQLLGMDIKNNCAVEPF